MKGKEGFTLLEMVIALSIFTVVSIWAAGFLGSQMRVYKKQMQLAQAEAIGDRISFQIAHSLEKAVAFQEDDESDTLVYFEEILSAEDEAHTGEEIDAACEEHYLNLESIDLELPEDYRADLDFSGTEPEKAVVCMKIFYKEEEILSRKLEFPALYGDITQEWDDQDENEDE